MEGMETHHGIFDQCAKGVQPARPLKISLYQMWERERRVFVRADHGLEGKKPFTIVMPPPNITGQLHMGHAMDCTPAGRPHPLSSACRATPPSGCRARTTPPSPPRSRSSRQMAKEGLTKEDLGREGFLERAWDWKERVRRPHRSSSCSSLGCLLRLGAASASPWTRAAPRPCSEVFVKPLRKGPHLPRQPHHQLVPALQDRAFRRRGGV